MIPMIQKIDLTTLLTNDSLIIPCLPLFISTGCSTQKRTCFTLLLKFCFICQGNIFSYLIWHFWILCFTLLLIQFWFVFLKMLWPFLMYLVWIPTYVNTNYILIAFDATHTKKKHIFLVFFWKPASHIERRTLT